MHAHTTHTHTHIHTHTHTHARAHTRMRAHTHACTHAHTTYSMEIKVRMSTSYRISHRVCGIILAKHKHFYNFKSLELKIYYVVRCNTKLELNNNNNLYYINTNFLKDYEALLLTSGIHPLK